MNGFRRFQWTAMITVLLAGAACGDTQYLTVEKEQTGRRVGEACVLDSQCEDGRCVAGLCSDGSCESDAQCAAGEICVFGACESADDFACTPTQQPLITVSATNLDFGEVAMGNTGTQVLTIGNEGDCLLTLSGVGLESNGDPGFACEPCDVSLFPQRVPPGRTLDVNVSFSPPSPGEASGALLVRSDDETAGDEGLLRIDLHASYSGVPVLVLEPQEINFGYVPYAQGGAASERTETIRVMNQGTGNATLTVQFVYVQPGTDFSIPTEFAVVAPSAPILLPPYNPNDPNTYIDVPVTFRPTRNANQETTLTVNAHSGDPAGAINVQARLVASSLGPPQINVSATELVYKQDDGSAYPVGMVAFRQITISNSGQSELSIEAMTLGGESEDFSVSPPFLPPIAPGGQVVLSVFYNPSAPSDPSNPHAPTQPRDAVLQITSNDSDPASDVLKVVDLEGWAKGGTYDDALKLEMVYENGDNSWAGNDFRDVDLEIISPLGYSCAKPRVTYTETPPGSGNYVPSIASDYCALWNQNLDTEGLPAEGRVAWLALGQFEEPERVLLTGLGQERANGGIFEVRAHYIEDCANIPTGIVADLLGIGVSALLGVLGGSVGVPIAVPPDQISSFISENCWDHASSLVTLHISVNGQEIAAPQQRIQDKGDAITLVRLKRENGQFTIVP